VYIFGGWDGQQRFNDLWRLTVGSWHWELLEPAGTAGAGANKPVAGAAAVAAAAAAVGEDEGGGLLKPCPRADHVMVRG
jgi:hypothetical protein